MIEKVADLLDRCRSKSDTVMPRTELFNEGWLLRVVLDWYSHQRNLDSPFAFEQGAKWYSEGRLSSPFLARHKGDQCAEKHTNADGIIGHFSFCPDTRSGIKPDSNATQLVVVEAKLGSGLSEGIKNAPYYNQVARNACCLAHIASKAGITQDSLTKLAFYVVAPESRVNNPKSKADKKLREWTTKSSIKKKVKNRAEDYGKEEEWYEDKFLPFLEVMCVKLITWEDILSDMESSAAGTEYRAFYDKCKCANLVK
ncbi:hypothetical protein [Candidatus Spongiihabitans sp.]|uniref:hypothetical protein n=1 Tax=Candidatus Spongiihabitans sp. TaxID=3101308 RepID=UPI003C6F0F86